MEWTEPNNLDDPITPAWADETRNAIDLLGNASPVALSTTNGMAGRVLTLDNQGGIGYMVLITFQTSLPGNTGEVSVTNDSATQATVYNTGNTGISFSYKVFK